MNLDDEIIHEIVDISRQLNSINKIVLFGSRARGDNELKSDIDIAIYAENNEDIVEFIERVENDTSTLLEFDFSNMRTVKDTFFIEQVEKEGIVLYEKC